MDKKEVEKLKEEKHIVSENMRNYGDAFIYELGRLILFSNKINLQKIKNSWAEEWKEFLNFVPQKEKK